MNDTRALQGDGRQFNRFAEGATMHSEEYRRIFAACLEMADLSNVPEDRARWKAIALAAYRSATELPEAPASDDASGRRLALLYQAPRTTGRSGSTSARRLTS